MDDPVAYVLSEMDRHGIAMAMLGTQLPHRGDPEDDQGVPGPLLRRASRWTRTGEWKASASSKRQSRSSGSRRPLRSPPACRPRCRSTTRSSIRSTQNAWSSTSRSACAPGSPARGCRSQCQDVALIDEVCWFFPELKFVTRHGCEPWADLAVKLMLKWPNLYYSTSRVRAEVLPEGRDPLREHTRRRQGHVRGLLPDGSDASSASSPSCPTSRSATTSGRSSSARTRRVCSSSMPESTGSDAYFDAWRGGVDRHDGRHAREQRRARHEALRADERRHPRQGGARAVHVPRRVHVQGRAGLRRDRRPGRAAPRGDGPLQHHAQHDQRRAPTRSRNVPRRSTRTGSSPASTSIRTAGWTACASSRHRCASWACARRRCSRPGCCRRSRSTTRSSTRSTPSAWSSTSRSSSTRAFPARACRWAARTSRSIDEVCWFFPELKFVMRHGAEPWTALAVKLMLKWPNLYYSTYRVRAQALPRGHRLLRQHAWCRQGHVRRVLPHGPEPASASSPRCPTSDSATTYGPSSCATTPARIAEPRGC